jgi:hypothetical protein
VASLPAMPLVSSDAASAGAPAPHGVQPDGGPGHGPPTARRVKDEPEFTADDRPVSFQHVFSDSMAPPPRRRWPLLLFSLIAGGAAGVLAVVVKSRGAVVAESHRDAGVVSAPVGAGVATDAGIAVVAPDAAPDAADLIVLPELEVGRPARPLPRPGPGPSLASMPETPNRRGTILVQVLTKPEGANLYDDGNHYRGPSGAQLEEPYGTRRVVRCKQQGYKPGNVEVNFDGSTTAVLCVLQRIKICIDNIKNPFDDCEIDPSAPSASP